MHVNLTGNRNRTIAVFIYLNEKENSKLLRLCEKSKLSKSAYLRSLINEILPTEYPPIDFFNMTNELFRIGNNLNQIARKAHAFNSVNTKTYDENVKELRKITNKIFKTQLANLPLEKHLQRYNGDN